MTASVYLVVKGGLGNQLFQAAFGIALEQAGARVRYLTHGFAGDHYQRQFLLENFRGLRGKVAPLEEAGAARLYRQPPGASPGQVLADIVALLDSGVDSLALDGYWQDEGYFHRAAALVRDALCLDLEPKALELAANLRAENCIAMHVRRSDYGHHGLTRADFYRDAIAALRAEIGPKPVLVFTDEYNFCNFEFGRIPDLSVVRGDIQHPLIDFHLAASCRHFILSNSSFSWWAAWLGETEGSLIFAPKPWCIFDPDTDPVPQRWLAVEGAVQRQ